MSGYFRKARNATTDLELLVHFDVITQEEAEEITAHLLVHTREMEKAYEEKRQTPYLSAMYGIDRISKMVSDAIKGIGNPGTTRISMSRDNIDLLLADKYDEVSLSNARKTIAENREAHKNRAAEEAQAYCSLLRRAQNRTSCDGCRLLHDCTLPDAATYRSSTTS